MKAITQAELYKTLSKLIKSKEPSTQEAVSALLHDLSPVGYVPLVKACTKYSKLKSYSETNLFIQIAISRVCGRSDRPLTEVKERFEPLEYPHLLDQLRALVTDLELYLMPDPSTIEGLSWRLWLDVCRALLKEVGSEEQSRLALILAGLSDELGQMVEVDMARLEREGPQVMARHLKALQRGGDLELKILTNTHAEELSERDQVTLITSSGAERYEGRADFAELMRGREREVKAGFAMMYCPAGEFWMGFEEGVGSDWEPPRHRVKISKPFLMGQTQITQALWEAVMGANPSYFKGGQRPVEEVSWYDMARFCNALSELEGFRPAYSIGSGNKPDISLDFSANGYRMPTEAEWEYAAKAGTEQTYAGSDQLSEVGWFWENTHRETHLVAQKKPNAWGLYDMSGNVTEWCSDQWDRDAYKSRPEVSIDPCVYASSPARRVSRGGSWDDGADFCRVAFRRWHGADFRRRHLGGRLLRWNLDT